MAQVEVMSELVLMYHRQTTNLNLLDLADYQATLEQ